MFFIVALFSFAFSSPRRAPQPPTDYTIVKVIGHIPRERKTPPRTYVILALPDSTHHYALVDSTTETITDYIKNPMPQWKTSNSLQ